MARQSATAIASSTSTPLPNGPMCGRHAAFAERCIECQRARQAWYGSRPKPRSISDDVRAIIYADSNKRVAADSYKLAVTAALKEDR